jgi:putative hemolysin
MTNRKNITAVSAEWTLEDTIRYVLNENNSRFPVYKEDIDDIIGILYLRDAMLYYGQEEHVKKGLLIFLKC